MDTCRGNGTDGKPGAVPGPPYTIPLQAVQNGVSEMRPTSIVIHKGKKEEKYDIYVEDYVISYLKEKTDQPDLPETLFYGRKEKDGRRYTIYGAGQDRQLPIFDKYDLLEEIGCRMSPEGPVFLVREADGTYEVKGYQIFYYENEEMQEYLIHKDREKSRQTAYRGRMAAAGEAAIGRSAGKKTGSGRPGPDPHYAISVQLGLVFIVLVAIVINSANSYHKMQDLNQSAKEVFFVMENQEADVTSDPLLEDNVLRENTLQGQTDKETESTEASGEGTGGADAGTEEEKAKEAEEGETGETVQGMEEEPEEIVQGTEEETEGEPEEIVQGREDETEGETEEIAQGREDEKEDMRQGTEEGKTEDAAKGVEEEKAEEAEEGVEALSRNIARYYEVKRGDTLYLISKKIYGDTSHVKKICEINQITDPDNIRYGQKLILP